jgi:hypothetical protein
MTWVRCRKCGCWLKFEALSNHICFNNQSQRIIPRYFFGPEIDPEGNIYHWESEDGVFWTKKLIYISQKQKFNIKASDDFTHDSPSDEDYTEPENGDRLTFSTFSIE